MPDILDYTSYTDRMRRSVWDKAFFLDKIPGADILIDIGCADGSLLSFIHELFPLMTLIGIDTDEVMVDRAKKRDGIYVYQSYEEALMFAKGIDETGSRIAVVFSSVLHEVFHYLRDWHEITDFIKEVNPEYIVIRDMLYRDLNEYRWENTIAETIVRKTLPPEQIKDFEKYFGSITDSKKNLVHLLLKYQYRENWERECPENYFSFSTYDARMLVDPKYKYQISYETFFVLPYLQYCVQKDFGINLASVTTHYKTILCKRRNPFVFI